MVRIIRANVHWLTFYSFMLLCWVLVLFMSSFGSEIGSFESIYGAEFWIELCGDANGFEDVGSLFLMWIIMSGAMMMPTFVPTLRTYQDLIYSGAGTSVGFLLMSLGFLTIWFGYSILIAFCQAFLSEQNFVNNDGQFIYPYMTTILLASIGIYQFSKFKDACASKCRAPLAFFMEFWAPGSVQSYKMGLRLGLSCLGCCWMLMLLAFVGGTMSVAYMGLATVIMILEKLPDLGHYVSKPLGCVLLLSACLTFVI